jgi:uncharacterized membrane protein
MNMLAAGLVLFIAIHLLTTRRAARAALIDRLGEKVYKGAYSAVAIVGLALVVYGFGAYRASGYVEIWHPPRALSHAAMLLVLPALVLFFVNQRPKSWIRAKARHPMLLGIKLWATAHLLANGDLGSIVLFGSLLGWAVFARASLKAREAAEGAPDRDVRAFAPDDWRALIVGPAVYALFVLWLHEWLFGVPVLD